MFSSALLYGMTVDEFWDGDPTMYFAFEEKYKMQTSLRQQEIWEIGAYVRTALQSTPVIATLYRKKDDLVPFPKMPKFYNEKPRENSEEKKELLAKFASMAMQYGYRKSN